MQRKIENQDKSIKNVIFISDLHTGCQFGLFPDVRFPLDGGSIVEQSLLQAKVWQFWLLFWNEWVPQVTRGEPYALVINGDLTDGRHHNTTTQVTQNLSDQRKLSRIILDPIIEKVVSVNNQKLLYIIRGTEAHVGAAGESEETLAEEFEAKQDEYGNYARWDLNIKVGNCLINALHHIGISGSLAYETTALMKEYGEATSDAARWGRPVPNIIARAHRHRFSEISVPTHEGYGICFCTPGWQLKTPFVWRISSGRLTMPQFGGALVRSGDEEFYIRSKVWSVQQSATEEI